MCSPSLSGCLGAYDKMIGVDLANLVVDGCSVKAPCGGEAAGPSPVDRGKQGTKRSVLTDGAGHPARRHHRWRQPQRLPAAAFDSGMPATLR